MVKISSKELIDNILSLPDAPHIISEVNLKLEEEKKRRRLFYNEITDQDKAEFINGEVIIHSPVKKEHNDAASALHQLISLYVKKNKLGYVGFDKIMIVLSRNDYEPDICFFNAASAKKFKTGQSLFPIPDLAVEVISKGTVHIDRGVKFEDYQAHGILEYWIVDPIAKTIEQYRLHKKKEYELILKAKDGWITSTAIKGFKMQIAAIFNEDLNLQELGRILKGD